MALAVLELDAAALDSTPIAMLSDFAEMPLCSICSAVEKASPVSHRESHPFPNVLKVVRPRRNPVRYDCLDSLQRVGFGSSRNRVRADNAVCGDPERTLKPFGPARHAGIDGAVERGEIDACREIVVANLVCILPAVDLGDFVLSDVADGLLRAILADPMCIVFALDDAVHGAAARIAREVAPSAFEHADLFHCAGVGGSH